MWGLHPGSRSWPALTPRLSTRSAFRRRRDASGQPASSQAWEGLWQADPQAHRKALDRGRATRPQDRAPGFSSRSTVLFTFKAPPCPGKALRGGHRWPLSTSSLTCWTQPSAAHPFRPRWREPALGHGSVQTDSGGSAPRGPSRGCVRGVGLGTRAGLGCSRGACWAGVGRAQAVLGGSRPPPAPRLCHGEQAASPVCLCGARWQQVLEQLPEGGFAQPGQQADAASPPHLLETHRKREAPASSSRLTCLLGFKI